MARRLYLVLNLSVAPGPNRRIAVVDCPGCEDFISSYANPRKGSPATCPNCGRPKSEAVREFFLVTKKRESA